MKVAVLTTDSREHFRQYERYDPYFGTAPEALLQGFAMLPDVEVHVISCVQEPMKSPEKLAPNIWYHGLHVTKLGWLRTGYQGCLRAVRRKLQEIQPDIVHGQGTERDCALTAVFSGFPNVLTIHGNMQVMAQMQTAPVFSFYWLAAKLERLCLARTNGVVCITDYTRKLVVGQTRQTWTLPNAVDKSFFEIGLKPPQIPKILSVGNICPRKNQNAFIRAMDPISADRELEVIFLGSCDATDPYAVEFADMVANRPWCHFEGMADRETLRNHFSTASLLVLASLEDNCPMVVLEAMAAAVPVVAGAVGGVPELIENGVTGLLCDPTSERSMQDAVVGILAEPEAAKVMAQNAQASARRRFHPMVIAQKHLEIYRDVLGSES